MKKKSPPPLITDPAAAIREQALSLKFDAVGFSPAEINEQTKENLRTFLARGYHGDMGWMENRLEWRENPTAMWEDAKSIIVLGVNYGPSEPPLANLAYDERGNISVYARNRDYHDFIKKRLKALARWMVENLGCQVKVFVDTAPVLEKVAAAQSGIGWQGKNTHLVSREHGSWLFLGEIYTDLDLKPEQKEEDHCGTCNRCLTVCPTDAFPAPYVLDAKRCISYLTIEYHGHIAREFRAPMGNRIYGCDDCIAVCPWNKFAEPTSEENVYPRIELTAPRLADLAELDDAGFRQIFSGSPVKRIGRDRFIRNVLIGLGNCGDAAITPRITPLLSDPSPYVRAMAVWALGRLQDHKDFSALRHQHLSGETDPDVVEEWKNPQLPTEERLGPLG
ncbi:tRNA epoxyqueuosine(34) reductase QueG [Kiloniella laminariae]|uniref:Epoxyqueuosine reductase n=1 Tax=Kiloniella laminariae TaxID=454162 RepID=A0ABT4LH49_9PROT|nr:tRNA epoxyqueuosine(34) reductase QueG [Kiloniella laminariae]MCZ4279327.1 tRNA epoxyqueuosine(34) reductase QueG [Kiloniella laminariae]